MNNTFYKNYKQIKEKLDYTYKGYNVKLLVAGYLNFVFDGITPSSRDVLKSFYLSTKSLDLRPVTEAKSPVVISYLIERQDYRNLVDATQKYYKDSEVIPLSSLSSVNFSWFSWFYFIHFLKASKLVFTRSVGDSLKVKLNIIAILILLFNQIRLLEKVKHPTSVRKYICFNSSYREESLLTAYFNKHHVETITLQHGIFCDYKLLVPFDYINFENRQAKQVLSWGQATIDYFTANGIDSSHLILFGNPKYKDLKLTRASQSFKSCLVLLGRELYIDTNNKLLELLTQYTQKYNSETVFYIKKHPFLRDEEHKKYANIKGNIIFLGKEHSVEEVLKSSLVDFAISVNTTAYYEALALGKPCLRWTEAENEDFYGMDDKFANEDEFVNRIEKLKTISQDILLRDMRNVIRYIFNPGL